LGDKVGKNAQKIEKKDQKVEKWEKKEKKSGATPQVQTLNDRFP
jgi:hypothetical protein